MKKLKWKSLVLALLVILLTSVSAGTLAYFTAKDVAHNVITSGGVKIELIEKIDETTPWPDEGVSGIMPGQDVAKIVSVQNIGQSEAWIRIKADVSIAKADGTPGDISLIEIDFDDENWTERDGYWYYNTPVTPGEETLPLFTTVSFKETMNNPYQDSAVSIDVSAQAVQVANNPTAEQQDPEIRDVLEAKGWPGEDEEE